ncbi:TnpV protein [Clostridium massiliamazoniense]|uniref:TnpV protein n=1 Tax=Clostridium massiliamazoniense TaxID=1347366 RepID=UPI000A003C89|nr:TnpV protein [Clostridium massiliamazoniense]
MQRFITDERTGIRYELIGDYYYPCLSVEEKPTLSKYWRLRERYLREHREILYFNLLTSGKLYEHLVEIDTSACNMAEFLIKDMAIKQDVTEKLKAEGMMRWVGLMNNIRACADEIVLNDIVYS